MQTSCFNPSGSPQTGEHRQIQFLESKARSAPSGTRDHGLTQGKRAAVFDPSLPTWEQDRNKGK